VSALENRPFRNVFVQLAGMKPRWARRSGLAAAGPLRTWSGPGYSAAEIKQVLGCKLASATCWRPTT
jgi:hypothetical protein